MASSIEIESSRIVGTAQYDVMCFADVAHQDVVQLLQCFGMEIVLAAPQAEIPGSFWGDREAGLIGNRLYVRDDTPIHSLLHEACHFICMDTARRAQLNRDAGGDFAEEDAVCYLQILLSDYLHGCGRSRMCQDMDAWGYTFRLGSAQQWFDADARDAQQWLLDHDLVDAANFPRWRVRG